MSEVLNIRDGLTPAERQAYIRRLEKIALDADGYRCDSCGLVWDCDETHFGECCYLCDGCYAEAMEAEADTAEGGPDR